MTVISTAAPAAAAAVAVAVAAAAAAATTADAGDDATVITASDFLLRVCHCRNLLNTCSLLSCIGNQGSIGRERERKKQRVITSKRTNVKHTRTKRLTRT